MWRLELSDEQLDEASGGVLIGLFLPAVQKVEGQTGSDLLIVNNGDGSDFQEPSIDRLKTDDRS